MAFADRIRPAEDVPRDLRRAAPAQGRAGGIGGQMCGGGGGRLREGFDFGRKTDFGLPRSSATGSRPPGGSDIRNSRIFTGESTRFLPGTRAAEVAP